MASHETPAQSAAANDAQTRPHDSGGSLSEVLAGYVAGGFTGSFSAVEGANVECHECNSRSNASRVRMSSLRRLEGASDPDEMVAVVAIECPSCNAHGTLVLGFGPMASVEDSDVLHCLQDFRSDGKAPGNSAPGEVSGDSPATDAPAGATPTA